VSVIDRGLASGNIIANQRKLPALAVDKKKGESELRMAAIAEGVKVDFLRHGSGVQWPGAYLHKTPFIASV
jgi:hypothetical protein